VDVLVIGGGPAGAVIASLLAMAGRDVMVVERDIHPRDHVGESLTPSTNTVFQRIGFLEKMEEAGFVHKPGACWTAPDAPVGKFLEIRLAEFPPPWAIQPYTYNVERDVFDAMLLRHAHELGAKVVQGARVQEVLFDADGRASGARVRVADGWEHDVTARFVVDASGRNCLLGTQLGLKKKDPSFNQFGIYSWFTGLAAPPAGTEGMLFLHFLGLERAWAWQIPLRNGVWSVGVVTDKADFREAGTSNEAFFASLVARNRTFAHVMAGAERIRPFSVEGDYSYVLDRVQGDGWLLIGDSLRFVDPIFSTGVDVAAFSALYGFEAIEAALAGGDEAGELARFETRLSDGVEAWYELIKLFYTLQNLFSSFAVRRRFRERVVRILQGNLYMPETLAQAREVIALMKDAAARVGEDADNLLRPGALRRSS
jgi:flavin-dependent dehydrogenase